MKNKVNGGYFFGVYVENYMIYIGSSPKEHCEGSVRDKHSQEKSHMNIPQNLGLVGLMKLARKMIRSQKS